MRYQRLASFLPVLLAMGCIAATGCDTEEPSPTVGKPAEAPPQKPDAAPPGDPDAEPPTAAQRVAVPNAGDRIESATFELDSPNKMIPVRPKVRGTVGVLKEEHNNIYMTVACDIGGRRYVETERELGPKSNEAFEFDRELFGGLSWSDEGPLGDCDAWLTLRESLGSRQYREFLIAASCRRDEAWKTDGCPGLPEAQAPAPIGKEPADVEMVWGRPFRWSSGWGLKVAIDYGTHQHIHPGYDLGATVRCTAGTESVEYWDRGSFTNLSDLQPGERARGLVSVQPGDGMSNEPEQCEVRTAIKHKRKDDELYPLQTFCWTPEAIEPGKCGAS